MFVHIFTAAPRSYSNSRTEELQQQPHQGVTATAASIYGTEEFLSSSSSSHYGYTMSVTLSVFI
jgi:hypothetical protein